jgi:PIN domain nuclease of toxin-antitoxin system
VKVLLDTCTLLWATLTPHDLSRKVAAIIADPANEILVSAASAWEIAIKVRNGKLVGAEKLELEFIEAMDDAGYTLLPIDVASALRAGRMTSLNKDPYDRILAAQALAADIPILSADEQLDSFGIRRIW